MACAKPQLLFLIGLNKHHAGAKGNQIDVELMDLLLEVRSIERLVHDVLNALQPLHSLIVAVELFVAVAQAKPARTAVGQHTVQG